MKRLLPLLAVLCLLSAHNPPAADATPPGYFYLAPYTPTTFTYHGCRMEFTYGQFGSLSFARMAYIDGLCSSLSAAQVFAWGDASSMCSWYIEDTLNPGDCAASIDGRGVSVIQATAGGSLLAGTGRWSYNGSIELDFSPFL